MHVLEDILYYVYIHIFISVQNTTNNRCNHHLHEKDDGDGI